MTVYTDKKDIVRSPDNLTSQSISDRGFAQWNHFLTSHHLNRFVSKNSFVNSYKEFKREVWLFTPKEKIQD